MSIDLDKIIGTLQYDNIVEKFKIKNCSNCQMNNCTIDISSNLLNCLNFIPKIYSDKELSNNQLLSLFD